MTSTEEDKLIEDVYYNLQNGAAYAGPQKIYEVLKKKKKNPPGLYKIRKWLQSKDDYTLQKPIRRRFKTPRIVVTEPLEMFDADLATLSSISSFNDNFQHLLIVIDCFSRYLWVEALQTKTGNEVLKAFQKIFERSNFPKKLRTDSGGEFSFTGLKRFLKSKNVYHHFALNSTIKASLAERVILTLKRNIFRFLTKERTNRYIDKLQDFVASYNNTPHSSLGNIAPSNIDDEKDQSDLWAYMYLKKNTKSINSHEGKTEKPKHHYVFRTGDMVRISHLKRSFQKSYDQQWTSEIFKIAERFLFQGFPMFKIIDFKNRLIKGWFQAPELQKVVKNADSLWYIEKIIRKRKRHGRIEYFVKWQDWDDSYNSWIPKSDVEQ